MDFELAIMMAAKEIWPGIIIQGCRFHWGQCLQRFFARNNMIPLGESSAEFLKIFHCCLGLPIVRQLDLECVKDLEEVNLENDILIQAKKQLLDFINQDL